MIRLISLSLIALAPLLLGASAFAQNAPVLKSAAHVSSDLVKLGDLVANAGSKADVAAFRAPDLGQTGKVATQDILTAATAHGLTGIETGGLDGVSVTRASRIVTAQDVTAPLLAALAPQAGAEGAEAIEVDLDAAFQELQLPVEADGAIEVADVIWQKERGLFDASVVVRRIDGRDERRVLRGRAVETAAVLTARRPLDRGAIVTAADVEIERKAKTVVRDDMMSDGALAVGMEVRRALREGQALRAADLVSPTLVKSGATVTIILKSTGLTLTATAQALRDGKAGDYVQVMNVQSKRVLQALVTGPDQVTIQTPRTIVSAAK